MSAIISSCGKYRYQLDRVVNPEYAGRVLFIGVNPSTADAELDDATVRKWKGFVSRWSGFGNFTAANVFAYRATDVKELRAVTDACGPENWATLERLIGSAQVVVPCWGRIDKVPKQLRVYISRTLDLIMSSGKPVFVFGYTKNGMPQHPLMLPYNTTMIKIA